MTSRLAERHPAVSLSHFLEGIILSEHIRRSYKRVTENLPSLSAKLVGVFTVEKPHIFFGNKDLFRLNYNRYGQVVGVCVLPELDLLEGKGKVIAGCCHIDNGSMRADKSCFTVLDDRFNINFYASDAEIELIGERVAEKLRLFCLYQSERHG